MVFPLSFDPRSPTPAQLCGFPVCWLANTTVGYSPGRGAYRFRTFRDELALERHRYLVRDGAARSPTFLLAYVLANHVFRTTEASLLKELTAAALTLDRGRAVTASNTSTLENTGGAAVIALWSLWVVLVLPVLAFRQKRTLFASRAYALESDAFEVIGQRCPREFQLDLVTRAMLALSIVAFGAGTILYGLTRPTGEHQLTGAARYVVGAAFAAVGFVALVGVALASR